MTSNAGPPCLADYRVSSLPSSAFYIPEFLSAAEEDYLLQSIGRRPVRDWTELSKRRLQVWPSQLVNNKLVDGSLPTWLSSPCVPRMLSYSEHSGMTHNALEGPSDDAVREPVTHIFAPSPHHKPNHVLINEYKPGQGIMPHEDGSAYHPVVATVSLGAPIVLNVFRKNEDGTAASEPTFRILQEPRSLLITTNDLYDAYLHGIEETDEDNELRGGTVANWDLLGDKEAFAHGSYKRQTRTSLTFRDVKQVVKASRLFPGVGRR